MFSQLGQPPQGRISLEQTSQLKAQEGNLLPTFYIAATAASLLHHHVSGGGVSRIFIYCGRQSQ